MVRTILFWTVLLLCGPAIADLKPYHLQPGDALEISIWKEEEMKRTVLVLPDGTISYPLAGHLTAAGKTAFVLEKELTQRLSKFFKDAPVSVSVVGTQGNKFFVIGQVQNPGAFKLGQPTDVMQALSLAGGLGKFADQDEIVILRRLGGKQRVINFNYKKVQAGRNLSSNILLQSGDVVVVRESGLF